MSEYYLKILSGNHIGAEIPIAPGQYSLGKSDNCDLVLTDDDLDDIELSFTIVDGGRITVELKAEGKTLYLNGEASDSTTQCGHFDIITSSRLFFAIGPADAQWPALVLPTITPPATKEVAVAEDAATGDDPDNADEQDLSADDFEHALPVEEAQVEEDQEEEDDSSIFDGINKKWLAAIPVALIMIVLLVSLLMPSGEKKVEKLAVPTANKISEQAKKNLGLRDIKFKRLPDKSFLVTGYTPTLQDKLSLQKYLRSQGVSFSLQVTVMNEMRDNAELLLIDRGYNELELELDNTPGSLVLSGYVATASELDSIIQMLKQEIYGLVSVVDQVENQVSRVNSLRSMLREKGLIPRIQVMVRDESVLLKGHLLDDGQIYDLQTIVTKFQQKYGNKPLVELATKKSGDSSSTIKSALTLNVRSISMGKVPYMVLMDGSKYLVGAKLPSGYILKDIGTEYLLLSNGTNNIKYRLGGNRDGQN